MFKLALVQMKVEGGEPSTNIARAVALIGDAAAQGTKVILLPEAFTLGWTHPSALRLAESIPSGPSCQALIAAAMRYRVYVCAGLVEKEGVSIYNAAVLIDPQGNLILRHRKVNELNIGHQYYEQGQQIAVVKTPLGSFGLMICADAFVSGQVISRTLACMGADVILSPSSWAVSADHDNGKDPYGALWQDNYGVVARDFGIWIAGVSNVGRITAGPWKGHQCIGCSLVVGPDGRRVMLGPYGEDAEAILYANVVTDQRPTRATGWMTQSPYDVE